MGSILMSDIAAPIPSSAGISRSEASRLLGGHPVSLQLRNTLKILLPMALVAAVLFFCGPAGVVFAMIILCLWSVLSFAAFSRFTAALVTGARFYAPTVEALTQGRIGCSYVVRGILCLGGIVIVDEPRRRIWLNGQVLDFADIKRLDTEFGKKNTLLITVKKGANPVVKIEFDSKNELDQAFGRLCNTPGMS